MQVVDRHRLAVFDQGDLVLAQTGDEAAGLVAHVQAGSDDRELLDFRRGEMHPVGRLSGDGRAEQQGAQTCQREEKRVFARVSFPQVEFQPCGLAGSTGGMTSTDGVPARPVSRRKVSVQAAAIYERRMPVAASRIGR